MTILPFSDSVKTGLLASGWYAKRLNNDVFPGVLTLCYHGVRASANEDDLPFANLHVIAETFDAHCRVIAETCHPIDLGSFCDARATGRALPERPVLVTFDDGYRRVFELARPILQRYHIPAAIFVCSEPVRRQRLFWFDAVARALGPQAVEAAREMPDELWRSKAREYDTPAAAAPALAPMTESQVKQLADEGFAFGAHTATHAPLAQAPAEVQRGELSECRSALESWTGQPIRRWPIRSARPARTTARKRSRSRPALALPTASRRATTSLERQSRRLNDPASWCSPGSLRLSSRIASPTRGHAESPSPIDALTPDQRSSHGIQPRAVHRGVDRERSRTEPRRLRADHLRRPVERWNGRHHPRLCTTRLPHPVLDQRAQSRTVREPASRREPCDQLRFSSTTTPTTSCIDIVWRR